MLNSGGGDRGGQSSFICAIAQRRHFLSGQTASSSGLGRSFISRGPGTCSTDGWSLDLFRAILMMRCVVVYVGQPTAVGRLMGGGKKQEPGEENAESKFESGKIKKLGALISAVVLVVGCNLRLTTDNSWKLITSESARLLPVELPSPKRFRTSIQYHVSCWADTVKYIDRPRNF